MEEEKKQKTLRVLWEDVNTSEFKYTNNLAITQAGDEFHLIFGHLVPPNTANFKYEDIPDIAYIKPVSCLVVSPDNLKAYIKVLTKYYENYKKTKGGK